MVTKMAHSYLLLLFLLVFITFISTLQQSMAQTDDPSELATLLTIKKDWGNPSALSSWSSQNASYCTWAGVIRCVNGQVSALSFQSLNMTNPVPASICNLKNLSYLDLSYNNLTGQFPTAPYGCSALQFLDLSNNLFSGALPADIDKLSSPSVMEHLNLSSNGFTGSVPPAIAKFPKLSSLVLDSNSFNGTYPGSAIASLSELETLTLAINPFAPGPIPDGFRKLKKLKLLWMEGMNLTGRIPDKLSSLTELTLLALSNNKLHGKIPGWIWKLPKLEILYLYSNSFNGAIEPNITAVNLQEIDLSENWLSGPIPESIGSLRNLSLLYLYFNNLTGPIPSSVGLLPKLADIRLFYNSLSGHLPPELGKHSPLGNLVVANNLLSGELPDTLCFNQKLYDIVVFNNSFSGAFPAILGDCVTVNNIMAYNNHFTGEFPEKVWMAFPNLTNVMIQNNSFTGTMPSVISPNITRIEMGNNQFSGDVPTSAPRLTAFLAENNQFSGTLPENMSGLANLNDLNLAGNRISGSIPDSIRSLEHLNYLNFSSNKISGEIPSEIGLLTVLTILDLSNNELTGEIPQEFNYFHLNYLNLSSNQLVGEVPASIQSPVFHAAFIGNRGLCARQDAGILLPTCSQGGGHGSARMIIILTATISSISVISFVAVMGWFLLRRKSNSRDVTSWKMIPFGTLNFSAQDIISNISEENVIGRGGSGKVYRINLGSHKAGGGHGGNGGAGGHSTSSTVAVKKIGKDGKPDAHNDKEFEAEARSLGGLLHGNIVKLLCCISGDDTKLLVYEYMENGSLDRWLHRRGRKSAAASGPLDWRTRLSIAIDVARGLSYMHHGFTSPIIHRDIKCSNILLDRGFQAKIADFGLARILAKSGESEPVSAVCGTFGYIAPEYVNRAKVNEKVDVYSFGVVLLELTTGRGPQDGGTESGSCLAKWASKRFKNGGVPCVDLVDGEIQDPAYLDDMVAVFELGVTCTGEDPALRPPMSKVLHRLVQCGQNQLSIDEDTAKDVCGVVSMESDRLTVPFEITQVLHSALLHNRDIVSLACNIFINVLQ